MTPAQFKTTRLAMGMTQKQMAVWLYTNERRIRAWEKGEAAIPGGVRKCLELVQDFSIQSISDNIISKNLGIVSFGKLIKMKFT